MKVIYCNTEKVYVMQFSPGESVTIINTEDIVEAREEFLKRMKWMFNNAVCETLNGAYIEQKGFVLCKEQENNQ